MTWQWVTVIGIMWGGFVIYACVNEYCKIKRTT